MATRLAGADDVYLADVASVERSPLTGPYYSDDAWHKRHVFHEVATLTVTEVFKGDMQVGQQVVFEADVSPGNCALSASNDPEWISVVAPEGEPAPAPLVFTAWLIYERRSVPVRALGLCDFSRPIELLDEGQLDALRALATH